MDRNNNGYVGKISNAGAQSVKAPQPLPKGKLPKVKCGTDLRVGEKKTK